MRGWLWVVLPCLCVVAGAQEAAAPAIEQVRGVDQRLDYRSLTQYGPWDDRNYQLTKQDLQVLAPNETELRIPIPAFFRVELRKRFPSSMRG
ncbi:MAG: hypothetical protein HYV26_12950 [Candidatus Hydrogenedentes bacterium]|nr:hypothetical protein [Candidatus Hydrogenedentota bacterium]